MAAIAKLTWVELKLFAREPFALIFTIVFPLVVLVSLAGSFNQEDPDFGGVPPSDYYLASYIAVVIAAVGLVAIPVHVATYGERGVIKRFRAASLPSGSLLAAQVVVGLVMCVVGSVVLVIAGRAIYDAALPEKTGLALLGFFLGALAFLALGFLLGSLTRTARAAQAVGLILFFPLWLLSGAGPPPAVMSETVRDVADALPLTFVVSVLQDSWFGKDPSLRDLALLGGMLVVAALLSIRISRRA